MALNKYQIENGKIFIKRKRRLMQDFENYIKEESLDFKKDRKNREYLDCTTQKCFRVFANAENLYSVFSATRRWEINSLLEGIIKKFSENVSQEFLEKTLKMIEAPVLKTNKR